jgi:hypothetical protein
VAIGRQLGQVGQLAVDEAKREVFLGTTIGTDDRQRPIRQAVLTLIDGYGFQFISTLARRLPPVCGG